jgi:hypothetical protein
MLLFGVHCRNHMKLNMAEVVVEKLAKLEPQNVGPYVLREYTNIQINLILSYYCSKIYLFNLIIYICIFCTVLHQFKKNFLPKRK